MIIDSIKNANFYSLNKIQEVLDFISNHDFSLEKSGKYTIKDSDIFYMMHERETTAVTESYWESHRTYTDIYYIIEGEEIVCYTNSEDLKIETSYNAEKDLTLYKHTGIKLLNPILLKSKQFMVLRPNEAHMANISPIEGTKNYIKKAIFKVKI